MNLSNKIRSYSDSWVISLEGGVNLTYSDYLNTKPGYLMRSSIEYYFTRTGRDIFGFKLFGGGQIVAGTDSRNYLATTGGKVIRDPLPPSFSTYMYMVGLAGSYLYSINDMYYPFVQLGLSYLISIDPKDGNGAKLIGNSQNLYKKFAPVFDVELGIKIPLSSRLNVSVSGGIHIPSTDYLDDIATGSNNDLIYTGIVGVSYTLFGPGDSDDDGILNQFDACPDEPEDFDGFEDDDGCPDYDNDFDGIPDDQDNCPISAEDFDGFADSDGCPDPDNDLDGILDVNDKCPNEAEDKDGFLDDDGCPDPDNDEDGIPDSLDKCPNQPETFNGFEDQDGCPDQFKTVSIKRITISGGDIFYPNTATIKPEGIAKLDEAIETIEHEKNSKWRIEGHMDSQGSEQFIRKMSYDRAEAVYEFFIAKGMEPNRLSVYGMSDDYPIADNTNEAGRIKNRRIEIIRED